MTGAAFAVDGLTVEFGGQPVLRAVTAAVRPGEAVALLGGNGSGKSTMVRAGLGLVPTSSGSAMLFGTPVGSFRSWSRVGYVPQRGVGSAAGATVREVVATGRLSRRRPFVPASRTDRRAVSAALDAVGLGHRAGDDVAHLSGGQQQRVLLARALAGEPELLILDEPISGVDLENQHVLAELLSSRLLAGTALLVVLHETGPLDPLLDRALVLRDGRLVHDGPLTAVTPDHPGSGRHEHQLTTVRPALLDGTLER